MPSIRQCFKLGCVQDCAEHGNGFSDDSPAQSFRRIKNPGSFLKPIRLRTQPSETSLTSWDRTICKPRASKGVESSTVLNFSNNQKEFFHTLWPYLGSTEQRNLRAACTLARGAANSLQTKVRLTEDASKPSQLQFLPIAFPNLNHIVVVGTLPEPVLKNIFQLPHLCARLTSLEVHTPSFINTYCLRALPKVAPKLQHLTINAKPGTISCEFLSACTLLPRLTSLNLSGCHALSNPQWLPLSDMAQLTSLTLEGIRDLPFHTLTVLLTPLERLASLSLSYCTFTTDHDYVIASGPTLCSLSFLTALSSISINHCPGVPVSVLNSLPSLPNLHSLALPASLPPSHHLPLPSTLQHLDLSFNQLPETMLAEISALPPLTSLRLASVPLSLPPSLFHPSTPTLRNLDVFQTTLPQETLSAILSLHTLTHLSFSAQQTSPPPALSQLRNLESLSCNLVLDRALLPILASLPRLTSLTVRSILLWPNSGTLSSLTHLCATSCHQFGDHDWFDIADATGSLRSLDLRGCSRMTDAGLANVPVHLPHITSLRLIGLYKVSPTGCLSLLTHWKLREVELGMPQMSTLQLFNLTQQMASCGLYARCGLEDGGS